MVAWACIFSLYALFLKFMLMRRPVPMSEAAKSRGQFGTGTGYRSYFILGIGLGQHRTGTPKSESSWRNTGTLTPRCHYQRLDHCGITRHVALHPIFDDFVLSISVNFLFQVLDLLCTQKSHDGPCQSNLARLQLSIIAWQELPERSLQKMWRPAS